MQKEALNFLNHPIFFPDLQFNKMLNIEICVA